MYVSRTLSRFFLLLLVLVGMPSTRAQSAAGDDNWDDRFTFDLLNQTVYTVIPDGAGGFYAGGEFDRIGNTTIYGIAHWTGSAWEPLGEGLEEDANVYALAMGADGSLYVGGEFLTTGGGLTVNNVARWDGSSWSAVGGGVLHSSFDATVEALALDASGNLYAGGYFNRAEGNVAESVAMWDGSSWSALGVGLDDDVYALTITSDGTLIAGGRFQESGGVDMEGVAAWTGTDWVDVGGSTNGSVYDLLPIPGGGFYATGSFRNAGGAPINRIARWDGTSWSALGSGLEASSGAGTSGEALALAPDGTLYVGGGFDVAGGLPAPYIAAWDGSSWSALEPSLDQGVLALALLADGTLVVGGGFAGAGGAVLSNIAAWDGTTWSRFGDAGLGMDGRVSVLLRDGHRRVYAGGSFQAAGGALASGLARWNGSSWNEVGGGIGSTGAVAGLAPDGDGGLYVGGFFREAFGGPADYLAHWDGSTWSPVGTPPDDTVERLASAPDGTLYAAGRFDEIGGVSAPDLAMWDGSTWTGLVDPNTTVFALVVGSDGTLYAAGGIRVGTQTMRVGRWDGTTWTSLASTSDTDTQVNTLALGPDGSLYAGGPFTRIGNVDANRVARWNGSAWEPLGSGISSGPASPSVEALAFDEKGRLYAGGAFGEAGGVPAASIARWDGAMWEPLGSGITSEEGRVQALVYAGGPDLWVGGGFTEAGGVPSNFVGRWQAAGPVANEPGVETPSGFALSEAYPNPFNPSTVLTLAVPEAGRVTVVVYDALGRQVATLHDGPLAAGTHALRLDAAGLPSGVYTIRAMRDTAIVSQRVTLLR